MEPLKTSEDFWRWVCANEDRHDEFERTCERHFIEWVESLGLDPEATEEPE